MINLIKENTKAFILIAIGCLLLVAGYAMNDDLLITVPETFYRLFGIFFLILSFILISVKYGKTVFVNIFVLIELLVTLEITCFILLGTPERTMKEFTLPDVGPDHIASNIGSVPWADSVYHAFKMNGADTVFDVYYTIDSYCKRFTPGHDSTKKKYSIFFGCSFSFGEGLNDNETFAYYYQDLGKFSNSYNFSCPGFATNHMLARLQYQSLTDQVKEPDGTAFYIFMWDHMYRAIGSMARYTDWLYNAPYFEMENGEIVRNKMFKNGRHWISGFYELVYQTSIIRYFQVDIPVRLYDYHFDLVTEMIRQSKTEYKKQFGNDRFYVILYPGYDKCTPEEYDKLRSYLSKKEIKFIDLTSFVKYDEQYSLKGDEHPKANTNKIFAAETLKRLNNFDPEKH